MKKSKNILWTIFYSFISTTICIGQVDTSSSIIKEFIKSSFEGNVKSKIYLQREYEPIDEYFKKCVLEKNVSEILIKTESDINRLKNLIETATSVTKEISRPVCENITLFSKRSRNKIEAKNKKWQLKQFKKELKKRTQSNDGEKTGIERIPYLVFVSQPLKVKRNYFLLQCTHGWFESSYKTSIMFIWYDDDGRFKLLNEFCSIQR